MKTSLYRVDCIKERFLVFLHISVVGHRDALHHSQDSNQISINTPRLSPYQFGNIGVFFLGHNTAAGGKRIGYLHKAELPA